MSAPQVPLLVEVHKSRDDPGLSVMTSSKPARRRPGCKRCTPRTERVGIFIEITHQKRCRIWRSILAQSGLL